MALLAGLLHVLFYSMPDRNNLWASSPLLLLPLFLWDAMRFGIWGVSLMGCLVSVLAIVLTFYGRGILSLLDAGIKVQSPQQYLAFLLLSGPAVVNDLGVKYRSLQQAEQMLVHAHSWLTVLN